MKDLSRYINKVPVKVELDTSMEKILAIQLLYKQVIDVMDTIEGGSVINVKSDWNAGAGSESEILNKPILKTVATSGDYNDLSLRYEKTGKFLRGYVHFAAFFEQLFNE